ncbi:Acetyltransferase (fragment) [Syntrophaceticus schinkii]|uniref:Acetyltransferase n=1 Tax=Syntrophaceticus schinkii TaxID=499207 RepID=A0A0B7MN44_9FIRM
MCRELNALGAPKIHLFAFNDNQTAANFYLGQGWEERRDIRVFSWDAGKSVTEEGQWVY